MSARSPLRRTAVVMMWAVATVAVVLWWLRRRATLAAATAMAPPVWPDLEPSWTAPVVTPERIDSSDEVTPSASPVSTWVAGEPGGSAPDGYLVKAKASSRIFHVPGGRFYDRTTADRWYATAEDAEADGYRRSKN